MQRRLELDAARGLMLVWMTLTHLPTALTPWVNQPFGFFSASDGFIFLSALFTGRIYFRLLDRAGPWAMQRKLTLRTLRLYGYHLLLLLFLFVVAARVAMSGRTPALYNLLHFYFSSGHAHAIVSSLLLIYRPPLLDIIPLYVIFLLISPLILLLACKVRIGWKYILGASFALWLAAQFGLRQAVYALIARHFEVRIPLNEMGAFDLWAWQLMWVAGMWCGVRWASNDLFALRWANRFWKPALAVVVVLLSLRYAQMYGLKFGHFAPLVDKWHLGALRLLDFSAVALVLVRFRASIEPLAVRPLVLMGQSSLYVFCTHFVFCFAGLAMIGRNSYLTGWPQFALLAVTFAALLGVAKLFARDELAPKRPSQGGPGLAQA
jgi:hypothetical protein